MSEAGTVPSVWRNRDFRLVLGGSLVNDIGDWMLSLALPVYVFTETGSGRDTAAVLLIELIVGVVCGPYGGALADRWDLRRSIVGTNVLQAISLLPLLAVTPNRIWPVFVVAALQALLQQVNNPASFALVPRVVSETQLVQANAASASGSSIARLVGAPLGGIAVGIGGLDTVVIVDSLTFMAVAAATLFVRTSTAPVSAETASADADAGVVAGWRAIRRRPPLVGYLVAQSLARVAFAMFPVLFITFVVVELHGGGAEIGIIRGCAAFGGLAASVLVARVAKSVNPITMMLWGYVSFSAVAALFVNAVFVTEAIGVYLALFALSGLPNATSQIGASATAQRCCPAELRGRLAGVMSASGAIGAAVGTVSAGLLVDHVDVIPLFNAQALVYLAAGVATWLLIARRAERTVGEGPPIATDVIVAES